MKTEDYKKKVLNLVKKGYIFTSKNFDKELKIVGSFQVLWGIFEKTFCNNNAHKNILDRIATEYYNLFDDEILDKAFDYMKQRYSDTVKFNNLKFRSGGGDITMKNHCKESFDDSNDINKTKEDKLKTLLYIIYRYRNNLFHGNKRTPIVSQKKNFFTAMDVLIELLNAKKRSKRQTLQEFVARNPTLLSKLSAQRKKL